MRTLSLDLRQRMLDSYDNDEGTRAEIARRFRVPLGMVKKLLQQRRRTGNIAPRHRFAGRKPMMVATHRSQIRSFLAKQNDLTLRELRGALGLRCPGQALHAVPGKMGLTYKKRHSAPVGKTAQTSPGHVGAGASTKRPSTRHG